MPRAMLLSSLVVCFVDAALEEGSLLQASKARIGVANLHTSAEVTSANDCGPEYTNDAPNLYKNFCKRCGSEGGNRPLRGRCQKCYSKCIDGPVVTPKGWKSIDYCNVAANFADCQLFQLQTTTTTTVGVVPMATCSDYTCSGFFVADEGSRGSECSSPDPSSCTDDLCCKATCAMHTCSTGFVPNDATLNHACPSSDPLDCTDGQCCKATCALHTCDRTAGWTVDPNRITSVCGTTPSDCESDECCLPLAQCKDRNCWESNRDLLPKFSASEEYCDGTHRTSCQRDQCCVEDATPCANWNADDCLAEVRNGMTNDNLVAFCHRCASEQGADPLRDRCSKCCTLCSTPVDGTSHPKSASIEAHWKTDPKGSWP